MNLRQLEVLRAVMKRRTTTGAAHELGMSQPAVSNAIRHAEDQLGFLLFDRVSNRLVPTREARILFEESESLFRLYDAFRRKTSELSSGRAGQISILVTSELSESLIPRVLRRFLKRHPEVHVSIDVVSLEGVLDGVEAGLADVGFAMAPHSRPGLVYEPLHEMEMVCACPAGHELASLAFVTPLDLKDQRLITAPTSGRIHTMVRDAFSKSSVKLVSQIEIRFMNIAARCVANGLGVGLVDALTASANSAGLQFLPFRPTIPVPMFSIVTNARPASRLARRLIQHAREETAEVPGELQAFMAGAAGTRPATTEPDAETPPEDHPAPARDRVRSPRP